MNYTKAMIDLVLEIRHRAGTELKPQIKLTNPNLFHVLIAECQNSTDAVVQALIKELVLKAGSPWVERLRGLYEVAPAVKSKPNKFERMYRGQRVILDEPSEIDKKKVY